LHLDGLLEAGAPFDRAWRNDRVDGGSYVATTIVAIDDFTLENGATRVVPGSHRQLRLHAPKGSDVAFPGERVIAMRAGSALVLSGHLWHSGTRNRSNGRRDALQIIFTRKDMPHSER
jgi:ectoine hydroxylase-related dioxygenase (phytanoyl-CoA dioxygenase family)